MNVISADKIADQVSKDNPVRLYVQVVDLFELWLLSGAVNEGDRLPATRELASALGVAHDTAVRCYTELKDRGLAKVQGRCTVLCGLTSKAKARAKQNAERRAVSGLLHLKEAGLLTAGTIKDTVRQARAEERGPYAVA